MDISGIILCDRYAYPPNSLHLCGPDKQANLLYFCTTGNIDKGNLEILSKFNTLYPYLSLIAKENNLSDPFAKKVVEAYWLGNRFLDRVKIRSLAGHLADKLLLKKKLPRKNFTKLLDKLPLGLLPNHAFHVMNIYKRSGNIDDNFNLQTMNACLINFGRVVKILLDSLIIKTRPLIMSSQKMEFGDTVKRKILFQAKKDSLARDLKPGDYISYHWGYFCEKLTVVKLHNLIYYTNLSLSLANKTIHDSSLI